MQFSTKGDKNHLCLGIFMTNAVCTLKISEFVDLQNTAGVVGWILTDISPLKIFQKWNALVTEMRDITHILVSRTF